VGLEQLALRLELRAALLELGADLRDRALDLPVGDVVVRRRPDRDVLEVVGEISSPVSGSNCESDSTSSPNSTAR
jgi:hypothetical protein